MPSLAVVAVARRRLAYGNDEAAIDIDDDLVIGRAPVVFRPFGDGVVAGRNQGAIHDQHSVLAEPLARLEREQRAEVVDDAIGSGLRDAEQRGELPGSQVCAPVRGNQQNLVLQRRFHGRPLRTGSAPSRRKAVINLLNCFGLSPAKGAVQDGSNAVITPATGRSWHHAHRPDAVGIPPKNGRFRRVVQCCNRRLTGPRPAGLARARLPGPRHSSHGRQRTGTTCRHWWPAHREPTE